MKLRAKAGRKYKATTDSGHALPVAVNLLGQDFSCDSGAESSSHAKAPDQVWLSDITYNTTRMHSSLRYKSPVQFERDCATQSIKAANDSPINVTGNNSQSARLTKRAA